jgi:hypothetical protein
MMSRHFPLRANEEVLFESSTLQVSAPAYQAAIRDVLTRIQATGRVTQIRSPLNPANANQIGHADQNAERVELVPDLRPAEHHHVRPPDVSDQPAERAATVVSARPPSSRNERSS